MIQICWTFCEKPEARAGVLNYVPWKAESMRVFIPTNHYTRWFHQLVPSSLVQGVLISEIIRCSDWLALHGTWLDTTELEEEDTGKHVDVDVDVEEEVQIVSDEICATLVDHVLAHGMSMREAGQRVQPNLSRFTVVSIMWTFREENG